MKSEDERNVCNTHPLPYQFVMNIRCCCFFLLFFVAQDFSFILWKPKRRRSGIRWYTERELSHLTSWYTFSTTDYHHWRLVHRFFMCTWLMPPCLINLWPNSKTKLTKPKANTTINFNGIKSIFTDARDRRISENWICIRLKKKKLNVHQ